MFQNTNCDPALGLVVKRQFSQPSAEGSILTGRKSFLRQSGHSHSCTSHTKRVKKAKNIPVNNCGNIRCYAEIPVTEVPVQFASGTAPRSCVPRSLSDSRQFWKTSPVFGVEAAPHGTLGALCFPSRVSVSLLLLVPGVDFRFLCSSPTTNTLPLPIPNQTGGNYHRRTRIPSHLGVIDTPFLFFPRFYARPALLSTRSRC